MMNSREDYFCLVKDGKLAVSSMYGEVTHYDITCQKACGPIYLSDGELIIMFTNSFHKMVMHDIKDIVDFDLFDSDYIVVYRNKNSWLAKFDGEFVPIGRWKEIVGKISNVTTSEIVQSSTFPDMNTIVLGSNQKFRIPKGVEEYEHSFGDGTRIQVKVEGDKCVIVHFYTAEEDKYWAREVIYRRCLMNKSGVKKTLDGKVHLCVRSGCIEVVDYE
jgi:hypothetical protein